MAEVQAPPVEKEREEETVSWTPEVEHESEILPFPNGERNFVLPEDIIHEVKEGKSGAEEELKDEQKEELLDQPPVEEGNPKVIEKLVVKEKVLVAGEAGTKEVIDKRKRNRATANLLSVNSNPSSPSGAKRRRV
ncbi:MRG/MORF4L-binding protein isoform X3 [Carcharodon carcharias]|uniref:MRG/MORF4L-binding protein isoform X3 n=1 Tax=Carcharodon carcharias TaxID=13397 RepID=UPI001B7EF990|nr:MRG/MORF4L-binding protein isoform X3 [Carcharodon carcharias]